LFADLANPISESIAPKQTLVGRRVIPLGDTITKGCWYNAGVQDDGEHKSIHLTASGPVIHSNIDTPRWINAASNILPTDHAFYERFGNDIDPTPQFLLDFYKNNITKYIRCNENDLASLTSWLVTALTNRPLSYIGEFVGPHNCGKSTGADFAKDLIDPSFQALGSGAARSVFAGKVDENFFALLNSQLITIFDNIGVLHPSVQDVLCQVSTGMKYNIRILYKQKQMENFIQRPVILTGLSKLITRPDLMSRAMTINFSEMPQINTRIMEEWYADKPFLFGGLLHLTSLVMKAIEGITSVPVENVSQREIVFAAVASVLEGKTVIDVTAVTDRKIQQYIEQITSNAMCAAMFAFFQEMKVPEIIVTTAELMRDFTTWLERNRGVNKLVQLSTDKEVFRPHEFVVSYKAIPESVNSFGWYLNKYHHAFEALSGWELDTSRRTKGVTRRYIRKLSLTDLF
jgi:hypothetical protein